MDQYFTGLFTCVHVLLSASFHSFNYRQIIYLFIYLLGGLLKDKKVYLDDVFVISGTFWLSLRLMNIHSGALPIQRLDKHLTPTRLDRHVPAGYRTRNHLASQ